MDEISQIFLKAKSHCTLSGTYGHSKLPGSRKRNCADVSVTARCKIKSCRASYRLQIFRCVTKKAHKYAVLHESRVRDITHRKTEKTRRPCQGRRRKNIAERFIKEGLTAHEASQQTFKKTTDEEHDAGNETNFLTKEIVGKMLQEYRNEGKQDWFTEIAILKKTLKALDTNNRKKPGYIQQLNQDEFQCYMFTEKAFRVLRTHLKTKERMCLYLDATGSVVKKHPSMNHKPFYYSLSLPGDGRGFPPLPVAELITCGHKVLHVQPWFFTFFHTFSQFSTRKVWKIETDFSWVLIHSVLLTFNNETLMDYLNRTYKAITKRDDVRGKTILHLCSAHIIKAMANNCSSIVADKHVRNFFVFIFARMVDATELSFVRVVFAHVCVLVCHKFFGHAQEESLSYLKNIVVNVRNTWDEDESEVFEEDAFDVFAAKSKDNLTGTLLEKSPFGRMFSSTYDKFGRHSTKGTVTKSTFSVPVRFLCSRGMYFNCVDGDNAYHCTEFVRILKVYYLPILPLWSGIYLQSSVVGDVTCSRDTNTYAELWFRIVKNQILKKERFLEPADFLLKLFLELQIRNGQHKVNNNLSLEMLEPSSKRDATMFTEDIWKQRRDPKDADNGSSSKFFSAPKSADIGEKKQINKKREVNQCAPVVDNYEKESFTEDGVETVVKCFVEDFELPVSPISEYWHEERLVSEKVKCLFNSDGYADLFFQLSVSMDSCGHSLCLTDFQTLMGNEWISSSLIMYYFFLETAGKDACVVPHALLQWMTKYAQYDDVKEAEDYFALPPDEEFQLMEKSDAVIGYINKNDSHWVMVYVKKRSRNVVVIDPFHNRVDDFERRLCDGFTKKAEKIPSWRKRREAVTIPHNTQSDGFSCGVYTMEYGRQILNSRNTPNHLDLKADMGWLRNNIAQTIVVTTASTSKYCTFCRKDRKRKSVNNEDSAESHWVGCMNENCCRWYHRRCLGRFVYLLKEKKYPMTINPGQNHRHCPMCEKSSRNGVKARYNNL